MACVADGKGNDKELIKQCVVKMLSRALQTRESKIIHERHERILLFADFLMNNAEKAATNLYDTLWGNGKVKIEI